MYAIRSYYGRCHHLLQQTAAVKQAGQLIPEGQPLDLALGGQLFLYVVEGTQVVAQPPRAIDAGDPQPDGEAAAILPSGPAVALPVSLLLQPPADGIE